MWLFGITFDIFGSMHLIRPIVLLSNLPFSTTQREEFNVTNCLKISSALRTGVVSVAAAALIITTAGCSGLLNSSEAKPETKEVSFAEACGEFLEGRMSTAFGTGATTCSNGICVEAPACFDSEAGKYMLWPGAKIVKNGQTLVEGPKTLTDWWPN